jgi:Ca2+-binding RTX toxin-like protein
MAQRAPGFAIRERCMTIQSTDVDRAADGFDFPTNDVVYVIKAGVDVISEANNGIGTSFLFDTVSNSGELIADGVGIYDNNSNPNTGGSNTFINNASGLITASTGLWLLGDLDYVGNYGHISATQNGIQLDGDDQSVSNYGYIDAQGDGIKVSGVAFSISNSGSIVGGAYGLSANGATGNLTITNTSSGSISASHDGGRAIYSSGANSTKIINAGRLVGGILLGDTVDTMRNSGNVEGDIGFQGGAATFDGRGGTVSGTITGDTGADTIRLGNDGETVNGGAGRDQLFGGSGADTFEFSSSALADYDFVHGFNVSNDTIELTHSAFAKLVVGVTPTFSIATKATSASDHLYYSNANGNLYYDADGNGATAPHLIAHFGAGLHLTASNFTVV